MSVYTLWQTNSLLCMISILVELNIFDSHDVKLPEGNCCHTVSQNLWNIFGKLWFVAIYQKLLNMNPTFV